MIKQVQISDHKGLIIQANLNTSIEQGQCLLTLTIEEKTDRFSAVSDNFFECLINIRIELEKKEWSILCQGASKDVYPSRMTLQMSNGRKAYKFRFGRPSLTEDIVDIFDPATIEEVSTVKAQRNNFEYWIRSLGAPGELPNITIM